MTDLPSSEVSRTVLCSYVVCYHVSPGGYMLSDADGDDLLTLMNLPRSA
jgi:hypothetical protein